MNLRFIAYSIILVLLGGYIIKDPQIYFVWGYIAIACSFFFAGLGISQLIENEKTSKMVKYGGMGLSVLLLLIIIAIYGNDLTYIFR